jgi:osmotically-inducible protein OsmY
VRPDAPVDAPQRPVRRGPGVLGWMLALLVGAALALLALQTLQDPRSLGTQLDDAVARLRAAGSQARQSLDQSQHAVADASSQAVDGVGSAISDAGITLKVKAALAADPVLSASRIDVDTVQGVVRLTGPAPDARARERASVLAAAPQGVRSVDNRLSLPASGQAAVAPAVVASAAAVPASLDGPAAEDAAVSARVDAALTADAAFARNKLVVSTREGVVRIEGVVPDAQARERAAALATAQAGVKSVDNRLLTSEAATLLARSPE